MEKSTRVREREASALFAYLKPKSVSWPKRLRFAEIDGRMHWSDGFLMLPVGDAMTDLLARYNLAPEPMVCEVGRTIVRTEAAPSTEFPDMWAKFTPKRGMVDVAPLEFGGVPLVQITNGVTQYLWSTDGETVTHRVDARRVAVVEAAGGDRWRVAAKSKYSALVRCDGKTPVGLLMGMRGAEGALGVELGAGERHAA